MSRLDRQLKLSDTFEYDRAERTKLSRDQVANFRKVSARRAIASPAIRSVEIDLNRPLPPLPCEPPSIPRQIPRKTVPPPFPAPADIGSVTNDFSCPPQDLTPNLISFRIDGSLKASEVVRRTLEQSAANGRQLTLRDELEMAVKVQGKQPPRVECSAMEVSLRMAANS